MYRLTVQYEFLPLLLLASFLNCSTSDLSKGNILFFHTAATASHRTAIWPLAEKLANAGYNITYVFPISRRLGSHPRIEELKPSKMFEAVDHFVGDFDINIRLNNTQDKWIAEAFSKVVEFCDAFYSSPETHEWLARPGLHYDLVMVDGTFAQCCYGLVHKFKAKHILFNPTTAPYQWEAFGVVPESASIPELIFHRKPDHLQNSLWNRVVNTFAMLIWRVAFLDTLHGFEKIVREKLELGEMPSFQEIEQETSLVLHNAHFIDDYPMSLPPMFVSYSGLTCTEKERRNRKPLPKDLESFISDGKNNDGFVYVSFGSAVVVSAMPEELRKQFFTTFTSFPQLRFLWKWTGKAPEDAPKNVLFQPWFPQEDVLAHPNIRAFITQAGRPSTQEALCYNVSMIAIPIFADQDFNADRLEQIGAAISLDITALSSEMLIYAIGEIVGNPKYKERMTELSAMFRDRPVDPLENAFYWVEYVLRHNTSLLKPLARHQTWWQRRLLDVYLFFLVVMISFITVAVLGMVWLVKWGIRRVKRQKTKKATKSD